MDRKSWNTLSAEEQNLYLTLLWEDGHSEKAIAEFFLTTKGRIVRRRQTTLKLATSGRPTPKQIVNPERFQDLLDLHAMRKLEEMGISAIAFPQICQWPLPIIAGKPLLCGKPVVPGHQLCEEHLAKLRLNKR